MREQRRQTELRLVIGFILLLLLVGDGLILLLYGPGAALSGLICLGAGVLLLLLLWGFLSALEWLGERTGQW